MAFARDTGKELEEQRALKPRDGMSLKEAEKTSTKLLEKLTKWCLKASLMFLLRSS